ncbi:MAG: hypothetical protein IJT33_08660 [Campylobacter sp.]|nr:hypothetical protein [Campylobacter sp.]MBQ7676507.1 hypothetical protein [Campylobacter sp.]MBR0071343.1 hypothetical protein [Campylobacter sp.]
MSLQIFSSIARRLISLKIYFTTQKIVGISRLNSENLQSIGIKSLNSPNLLSLCYGNFC